MGQVDTTELFTITNSVSQESNSNRWPTKDKSNLFKLNSVFLSLSLRQIMVDRHTYSLLYWIIDIGDLFYGLRLLASYFIAPMASFALRSKLLSQVSLGFTK